MMEKITSVVHYDRVRLLRHDFSEYALIFGRCRLRHRHTDQRDFQSSAHFPKASSVKFSCRARQQKRNFGCRWDGFLEDLEALSPDLVIIQVDPGDGAVRMCQARCESPRIPSTPIQTIGIVAVAARTAAAIGLVPATITSGLRLTRCRRLA